MAEYRISAQSGADWPAMPDENLSDYLVPESLRCEVEEDSDVLVLRVDEVIVSVSWELAETWYVDVEGSVSPASADSIVSGIAQRLVFARGREV